MKYRRLGKTDLNVPVLSFGASSLGSVFHETDDAESIRTVHTALDCGMNYLDVSPYYGLLKAERVLGQALKGIPRDSYILSTKAGRYGENEFDFTYNRIIKSAEDSMRRLGTDYLDILYLHDIEFADVNQILGEALPALQELKAQGKIRYTGISGLPLSIFKKVLKAHPVDVILSYCHYSLNDASLAELLPGLAEAGTGVVNASPLSMGLLTGNPVPAWHPATPPIREVCRRAFQFCEEIGCSLPKLAIQFSVGHPGIPTTLVSTANPDNIRRNAAYALEQPDMELIEKVLEILKPVQGLSWMSGRPEYNEEVRVE